MFHDMGRHSTSHITWRLTRAGGSAPDSVAVVTRAKSFGASVAQAGQATLLTMRDDQELSSYVIVPATVNGQRVVHDLANAVGASAEPVAVDETGSSYPPDLTAARAVGVLIARPTDTPARDTQSGGDPNEVALLLARSMQPGSWIAVTARTYSKAEVRAVRRWFGHRLAGMQTHYTNDSEATVTSMFVGSDEPDEVRSLLSRVAATMPGFDVETEVKILSSPARPALAWTALGLAAETGIGFGLHQWAAAGAAGIAPTAIGAGIACGVLPSGARRMERRLDDGRLPLPRRRRFAARKPSKESTQTNRQTGQVTTKSARPGGYPLHEAAFFMAPSMFVGLVSPHTGSGAGAASTTLQEASAAMLADIGPVVGRAGTSGSVAHVSAADWFAGVGLLGLPGSGKSVALQSLFRWCCLERTRPSGKPGRPGASNTLIAFEYKPEGVHNYLSAVGDTGDASILIEVAEPSSPKIDLFAVPGTPLERATFFVNAMTYAMGEQQIGPESFDTLKRVLAAGLVITPQIAQNAELAMPVLHSPVAYADILLCNESDEEAVKLAVALLQSAKESGDEDQRRAVTLLAPLFASNVTVAQRRSLVSAPRTKIGLLMNAAGWWDSSRPSTTWEQVVTEHWAVIVNTGQSTTGRLVDDRVNGAMAAMLLYTLRDAILRHCDGWFKAGRSVTIFADELALLSPTSPEVVTWLRNTGRSYGVKATFATQHPDQLLATVRQALLSFGTIFWFVQNDPATLAAGAADLSADGSAWVAADLSTLEPHHAILRATVDKRRQPAVPVRMADWDSLRGQYTAIQGY